MKTDLKSRQILLLEIKTIATIKNYWLCKVVHQTQLKKTLTDLDDALRLSSRILNGKYKRVNRHVIKIQLIEHQKARTEYVREALFGKTLAENFPEFKKHLSVYIEEFQVP